MASELQVNTITEATSGSGITFAKDIIPATPLSHRNMVINGAMGIWQRGTSQVSVGNTPIFRADRWEARAGVTGGTVDAVSDTPTTSDTKFPYALKFTVGGSAGSISASTATNYFNYKMEGQDFYHAKWGTAQAKPITLSFWVKSSVTGDYGLTFGKDLAQTYGTKYTISSANTWEKKTITVTGPTSGTWQNDNNVSLRILWNWGAGSNYTTSTLNTWASSDYRGGYDGGSAVQLVANANATWYITGVQLELGSVATPFEHRSYGEELARCERYCQKIGLITPTKARETDRARACDVNFKTTMRANCTVPSIQTTDSMALTISGQSPDGFHGYYTASSDGMAAGVPVGTIVTAEL